MMCHEPSFWRGRARVLSHPDFSQPRRLAPIASVFAIGRKSSPGNTPGYCEAGELTGTRGFFR
jgi:hypothetical protein